MSVGPSLTVQPNRIYTQWLQESVPTRIYPNGTRLSVSNQSAILECLNLVSGLEPSYQHLVINGAYGHSKIGPTFTKMKFLLLATLIQCAFWDQSASVFLIDNGFEPIPSNQREFYIQKNSKTLIMKATDFDYWEYSSSYCMDHVANQTFKLEFYTRETKYATCIVKHPADKADGEWPFVCGSLYKSKRPSPVVLEIDEQVSKALKGRLFQSNESLIKIDWI